MRHEACEQDKTKHIKTTQNNTNNARQHNITRQHKFIKTTQINATITHKAAQLHKNNTN
jgi:hypothetical protein